MGSVKSVVMKRSAEYLLKSAQAACLLLKAFVSLPVPAALPRHGTLQCLEVLYATDLSVFGTPNFEFSVLHSSADQLYRDFSLPELIAVVETCVCSGTRRQGTEAVASCPRPRQPLLRGS